MDPPLPSLIMDRDAYLITSNAPRALMLITLSKTAISVVHRGRNLAAVAGAVDDPQISRPSRASRTLSSAVTSKGRMRAPVSAAMASSLLLGPSAGDDVGACLRPGAERWHRQFRH